jgi:fructan beta-fructosidase
VVIDSTNQVDSEQKPKANGCHFHSQHDPVGEKAGSHFSNQSIAYSLDNGIHWQKYAGNPVVKTPGLKDFRDPK